MAEAKETRKNPEAVKAKDEPTKVVSETEVPDVMEPEAWGEELSVPDWKVAGMMAAMGWVSGKQVTRAEFSAAVTAFDTRGQGTGMITSTK